MSFLFEHLRLSFIIFSKKGNSITKLYAEYAFWIPILPKGLIGLEILKLEVHFAELFNRTKSIGRPKILADKVKSNTISNNLLAFFMRE